MNEYLTKIYELEKEPEEPISHKHDFANIDGNNICMICGEVDDYIIDDYLHEVVYRPINIKAKPYTKIIHIKDILNRLSGFIFREKKKLNDIKELLKKENINSIKHIRIFIKKNKLYFKNDFYYWKIKNNITTCITSSDKQDLISKYMNLKIKMSNRDFLFINFVNHPKYNIFAQLFNRKIKKKIQ